MKIYRLSILKPSFDQMDVPCYVEEHHGVYTSKEAVCRAMTVFAEDNFCSVDLQSGTIIGDSGFPYDGSRFVINEEPLLE